jgi:S1-C subfamily serine protease
MLCRNKGRLAILAVLLSFASFASSPTSAHEPSQSQIAQLKRAVVLITTYDDRGNPLLQGSGFFIDREQVVTNLHVIKGASQISIETFAGTTTTVQSVVATNQRTDLALLRIAQPCAGSTILPLGTAPPVEGESILLVSNPQGSRWKITRGNVGLLWKLAGRGTRLQITAAILPGSSGGPVVNERGQVMGIASSHASSADDLNFAVPVESLRNLRAQVGSGSYLVVADSRRSTRNRVRYYRGQETRKNEKRRRA